MITNIETFESQNNLRDLPPGRYVVVESVYRPESAERPTAILSEMIALDKNRLLGADLQVLCTDGSLLFRDFCTTVDGSWRDSYGARAPELAGLLPAELATLTLVSRRGTIVLHDGAGTLVQVANGEDGYGS